MVKKKRQDLIKKVKLTKMVKKLLQEGKVLVLMILRTTGEGLRVES